MNSSTPLTIDGCDVWQSLALTLVMTIYRTSYATQVEPLCHLLHNVDHYPPADKTFIQCALAQLYRTQGQLRMAELAAQCHLSQRQCERRFKELIGFTPKRLARLIRFETIRHRLLTEPITSLTDLAYDAGYSDQAHFINDFRSLAGCSPQQFIALATQRSMTNFYNPSCPRPSILSVVSTNL